MVLDKMIDIFLENSPIILSKIVDGLEQKDYDQVSFHAHKLKSSIDSFSIFQLTDEIRLIEKYAKEKSSLEDLPEGAVNIIFRNALSDDEKKKAVDDYRETFASPYKAAELGYIDEIIYPRQTRFKLIQALEMTQNKSQSNPPKKHGNIPL